METVHLLISGKVQGVFFRDSSKKVAQQLNIKGWIKNRPDEKVEAMISGDEKDVEPLSIGVNPVLKGQMWRK